MLSAKMEMMCSPVFSNQRPISAIPEDPTRDGPLDCGWSPL